MTTQFFHITRGILALVALLVLSLLAIKGWPKSARRKRVLAAAFMVVGWLSWGNFGNFHIPDFVHIFEMYHYYLGAKYLPELGYQRLYECALIAQAEDGAPDERAVYVVRNLRNNQVEPTGAILANPHACTERFSQERWRAFKEDVSWFSSRLTPGEWRGVHLDHGFNATPVWSVAGHWLTNAVPLSERNIFGLACIDPALLLAMWCFVYWAFGPAVTGATILFWGSNILGEYGYTGGSLLRFDWLFFLVTGISFLRKEMPAAGGFCISVAALLRIFPACVLFAVLLGALGKAARQRAFVPGPQGRRLVAGIALAAVPCIAALLSFPPAQGVWQSFFENTAKHAQSPGFNEISLTAELSFDPLYSAALMYQAGAVDALRAWRERLEATLAARRPLHYALVCVFAVPFGLALLRHPPWVGAVLGVGLIPIAVPHLTSYYYVVLLAYALLWEEAPRLVLALFGMAHLLLYPTFLQGPTDRVFFLSGLLVLTYVFTSTAYLAFAGWRRTRGAERPSGDDSAPRPGPLVSNEGAA